MDFYGILASVYEDVFPLSKAQLGFVARNLPVDAALVVDLGCGTGALARELSRVVPKVKGVDLSTRMIELGHQAAQEQITSGRLELAAEDMRETVQSATEAGAFLCLGNTLAHLLSREEVADFFGKVCQALEPGGRFICQIVNYDRVLQQGITELPPLQGEAGNKLERYYQLQPAGLLSFLTVLTTGDGAQRQSSVLLYPWRKAELQQLLREAGFARVTYYGSYSGDDWSIESFHTIFVAEAE